MKKIGKMLLGVLITSLVACNTESKKEMEHEEEEYDNPMARINQEFKMTVDPNLGIVPRERFYAALDQALLQQQAFTLDGITAPWVERGPNYDSVGVSNNNGRGGSSGYTGAYTSGRIKAFCVDLSDATGNTVFTGGVNGGIWQCNNFLSTTQSPNWVPVADYLDNIAISSICQNPANPDIFYATTGEPHSGYDVVNGRGVYKSIDHGQTWTVLANTTNVTKSFKIACDASGNVYWATFSAGLRRSTNGGISWTAITPTGTSNACTDLEFSASGRLHASFGYASGSVFYRYTSSPATVTAGAWTSRTLPTTGSSYRLELAVLKDTVYGVTANTSADLNNIFRSVDGGNNWVKMNSATLPSTVSSASGNAGQAWYGVGLSINPNNPEHIVYGVLDGYASADGGMNSNQISYWRGSGAYVHADYHNIQWVNVGNASKMIIAGDGGLYISEDEGTSFVDKNKNLNLKQFYSCAIHPTLTDYFLAGSQDNGTHQLRNAGLSYSREVTGGDGGFCAIDQNESRFQFTSFTNNIYFRSTNSGSTWSQVPISGNTGSFINPWAYDDVQNIIIAGSGNNNFLRWTNPQTGSTASTVSLTELGTNIGGFGDAALGCVTISPYKTGRAFLGSSAVGSVIRLENTRTTTGSGSADVNEITPSNPGQYASSIAVGTNDSNLMVTYSNYGVNQVHVTTDGGVNWSICDGNLPDIPVRWAVFHPTNNLAAAIATELGVYTTQNLNGAATVWVRSPGLPFCRIDMLKLRKSDNTLIAATHGRGLWSTNILTLLPLKNITLKGALKGENIANLNWQMVDATSNAKFFVQYSEDGINFNTIAKTNRETSSLNHNINTERGYFRVMGYEPGKSPIYSNIVSIKTNKYIKGLEINVAPNPMKGNGKINLTSNQQGEFNWQICNVQGSVLHIGRGTTTIGKLENINFNFSTLSSGLYLFRAHQNGRSTTISFLKD
jgi:trimeric autotransporter adhesin